MIRPSEVRLGAGVVDMYQNSVYGVLRSCDYIQPLRRIETLHGGARR